MAMSTISRRKPVSILLSRNLWNNSADSLRCTLTLSRRFSSAADERDVVVIGGGPGGYVAAIKAAQLGLKTTCIEKRGTLGGTCLKAAQLGCIPPKRALASHGAFAILYGRHSTHYIKKPEVLPGIATNDIVVNIDLGREGCENKISSQLALLHSSHMYHEAKHSFASHGVKISSVEVDLPAMLGQKDTAIANLTRGIEGLFKKNKVNYVKGYGKLVPPSEVSVDTIEGGNTVVKGKHIVIATGSDVKSLPGITNDEKRIVSSTGALALTEISKRLIVVSQITEWKCLSNYCRSFCLMEI